MMITDAPAMLASLQGRQPERPAWFDWAMSQAPEVVAVPCAGVQLDARVWGEPHKPGLLFLHGFIAHADWWSFIAPFFARHYRVVAFSWSGMGMSGWRKQYSMDGYADEIDAVAQATGLFEHACKPIVAAHSFASFPSLRYAATRGDKLRGVISMDTPLLTPEERTARGRPARRPGSARPNRVYATIDDALARFRFTPVQPCENLYIADHIARKALRAVAEPTGAGYTWSFDPALWDGLERSNPVADMQDAKCPLAFIRGADSALMDQEVRQRMRERVSPDTPTIDIPGARHHLMVDQPLALVAALRGLLSCWPRQQP